MEINGVPIEDTFAEAFSMHMNRTIITAYSEEWARITATEATGFGTSVIMAPAEAGIEYIMSPDETPDGRPGVRVVFAVGSKKKLEPQLLARLGQCVLTSPTALTRTKASSASAAGEGEPGSLESAQLVRVCAAAFG